MKTISVTFTPTQVKLRIISGKYGGRVFKPPRNFRARPTTDLAREGLFNILSNHIEFENLYVLDLFSGTGSIGLEFISRGAKHVDFIEKNYIHSSFIRKVISEMGISNANVIRADFFRIFSRIQGDYDVIFADPPYDLKGFETIPQIITKSEVLKKGGMLILEHSANYNFSSDFFFNDHRKYGGVNFSFFQIPK